MISSLLSITEFKSLFVDDIISVTKIQWWLLKYESDYLEIKDSFINKEFEYVFYRIRGKDQEEFSFIDLFEKLQEVSDCHKNEKYFKDELEVYDTIKNDVTKLNSWLENHSLDTKGRQSEFRMLFSDNSELLGYNFNIEIKSIGFKIKIEDFHYSLRFLNVIEKFKKIVIIGVVSRINNLEDFKEIKTTVGDSVITRPAFKRQEIILSTNDEHLNEYLIRFVNGKTELLKNIDIGQTVKIYVDLRGGNLKNEDGTQGFQSSLLGWDISLLEDNKRPLLLFEEL